MLARLVAQSKSRPDVALGRALLVAAFIGFWMLIVVARLVHLQFSQHEMLADRAKQQQQNALETNAPRGELLDRQGKQLARSVQTVSLFIDPEGLDAASLECTASELARTLGLKYPDLLKEFRDAQAKNKRFVWVARRLEAAQAEQVTSLGLPGLHSELEPKRYYPNGQLAAHVLGYVGVDGKGLGGVEQFYNSKISGEPGQVFVERDAKGDAYESYEIASKPGQTVVLTIDQAIQYQAEQALNAAIQRTRAKSGTVIVLDPKSGEILALANAPSFDPNNVAAMFGRGAAMLFSGQPDRAIVAFDRVIAGGQQNALILTARGNAHFIKSNIDLALADFERALTLAPSYAPALTGRGRVWRKKGDDDKAMADFDKAIALDERSIESRLARADIQLARRNQDAALVDLKRVVDLKPRDLFEVLAQTAAKAKIKELERDTCRDGSGQRDARCL